MKRLHFMILRMLPGPFVGWLLVIMFLLLMQFLMKYLPDIAGKGLPLGVILELIVYNLAYMLVLAVPMAVLITNLMVFGRLAETRVFSVMKSAGISFGSVIWPTLLLGILVSGSMTYFNNVVLPEANFRARNLWQDIRKKKPAFDLQAGAFYDGLNRYSILVQGVDPVSDDLLDLIIYDYTAQNRSQTVIKARRGRIESLEDRPYVDLFLDDGELHRPSSTVNVNAAERYERLAFEKYRFRLDLSDFFFERSDPTQGFRSDRTMPTQEMMRLLDSLKTSIESHSTALISAELNLAADSAAGVHNADRLWPHAEPVLTDVSVRSRPRTVDSETDAIASAVRLARDRRTLIEDTRRTLSYEQQRANRYRVEIHKKYSIAVACFVFTLAGAAIGISIKRGGLGMAGGAATVIFLFYWLTLVQGEKISDRGDLEPWIGMWAANMVIFVLGVAAFLYVAFDLRSTPSLLRRRRTPF